jgi:hypothetical protein
MNIPLRAFPSWDDAASATAVPDENGQRIVKLPPGTMYRNPEWDEPDRECWAVVLPNGNVWRTTDRAAGDHRMWDVTGTPPNITVTPSIDDRWPSNPWHGFITNGELVTC